MKHYEIEHGVAIDTGIGIYGQFTQLMSKLRVGDSFVMPGSKRASLGSTAKRLKIKVTSRLISDTEIRVWRVK